MWQGPGSVLWGSTGGAGTPGWGQVVDSSIDAWGQWMRLMVPKERMPSREEMAFNCFSVGWKRISVVIIVD